MHKRYENMSQEKPAPRRALAEGGWINHPCRAEGSRGERIWILEAGMEDTFLQAPPSGCKNATIIYSPPRFNIQRQPISGYAYCGADLEHLQAL